MLQSIAPYKTTKRLLTAAAFLSLFFIAGCDDHVQITRDRDVRILKNATWAWRPAVEEGAARENRPNDNRPVVSRDDVSRNRPAPRRIEPEDDVVRQRVKTAIEQTLASKGFTEVQDVGAADFLVDYKFGIDRHTATVPTVYGGGYPGLVCGPFRCWESWGVGPAFVGYENIHFHVGTIIFDWTQKSNNHLAYRAVGEKAVRRDAFSLSQNDVTALVQHLLKDLKPGK